MVYTLCFAYENLIDEWTLNDLSNKTGNIRCNQCRILTTLPVTLSGDFICCGAIRYCCQRFVLSMTLPVYVSGLFCFKVISSGRTGTGLMHGDQ